MAEFRIPSELHLTTYATLTPEIKSQLQALADEIGVPVGYITIGYATHFSYNDGTEDKVHESVSEFRNAFITSKNELNMLGAKTITITSHRLNLPDGTDYTLREYDKFEKIVKKWAKKAR